MGSYRVGLKRKMWLHWLHRSTVEVALKGEPRLQNLGYGNSKFLTEGNRSLLTMLGLKLAAVGGLSASPGFHRASFDFSCHRGGL